MLRSCNYRAEVVQLARLPKHALRDLMHQLNVACVTARGCEQHTVFTCLDFRDPVSPIHNDRVNWLLKA